MIEILARRTAPLLLALVLQTAAASLHAEENNAGERSAHQAAERELEAAQSRHGPNHPAVAVALDKLAGMHVARGNTAEAEAHYRRALRILETTAHPETGLVASRLARVLDSIGWDHLNNRRSSSAATAFEQALSLKTRHLGPLHRDTIESLIPLANAYVDHRSAWDAEALLKGRLELPDASDKRNALAVSDVHAHLSYIYEAMKRRSDARRSLQNAVELVERVLGPDAPQLGRYYSQLASMHFDDGALRTAYQDKAMRLLKAGTMKDRSLANNYIHEVMAQAHALCASSGSCDVQAERKLLDLLDFAIELLGHDNADTAAIHASLGSFYTLSGRKQLAVRSWETAVEIESRLFGKDGHQRQNKLDNLSQAYWLVGRREEAIATKKQACAISETTWGARRMTGYCYSNLADYYRQIESWQEAYRYGRTAFEYQLSEDLTDDKANRDRCINCDPDAQLSYSSLALTYDGWRVASGNRSGGIHLSQTFEAAQWATRSRASTALGRMAARIAMADQGIGDLDRKIESLRKLSAEKERALIRVLNAGTDARDSRDAGVLRRELGGILTELREADAAMKARFPAFSDLMHSGPVSAAATRSLLRSDEALMLFLVIENQSVLLRNGFVQESYVWIITKERSFWKRLPLAPGSIAAHVRALRCGLDATYWRRGESSQHSPEGKKREGMPFRPTSEGNREDDARAEIAGRRALCLKLLEAEPTYDVHGEAIPSTLPFPAERAHSLYKGLFAGLDEIIRDKHLLIVPTGPLATLPFQVLVTAPPKDWPKSGTPQATALRALNWLGTRQPITVIPSVASLQALRREARSSRASGAYLGFANPLLTGPDRRYLRHATDAKRMTGCTATATAFDRPRGALPLPPFASLFAPGGRVDIEEVRRWPPLPETADEACAVARGLGAPETDVYLGPRATETELKRLSNSGQLQKARVVHFATHGALNGQVSGPAEPGLIMTPPPAGTTDPKALDEDDGYLSVSEITQLRLDADLVILSACNTAGGDKASAHAMTGLARAFFYAGARSLLVSQWEVVSDVTARLVVLVMTNYHRGIAEAMKEAMRAIIESGKTIDSHPAHWAHFVVVGEGRACL